MAKLKAGLEEIEALESRLEAIETNAKGELLTRVLNAGAVPVVEAWKDSIAKHGHIVTHNMINNVAATEVRFKTDGASIAIYPQGEDNGITNARKAYIIHHGYGGHKTKHTGDKFATEAEKASTAAAIEAMQNELDKIISEG